MADTRANDAVTQQQEPMPSSDENATEQKQSEVAEQQEASEPLADGSEQELPESVSERTTREFEKLKEQLREERNKRLQYEQSLGSQSKGSNVKPLYDPETGLVDIEALNDIQRRQMQAEERAGRAESTIANYIENVQTKEAVSAYPELDTKSNKHDKDFYRATRALLMDSMAYPEDYGGGELSYKEAADIAKKRMDKADSQNTDKTAISKEMAAVASERLASKEQASLGASGQPTQGVQNKVSSNEEAERLSVGTRVGDKQSMIARMRNIRTSSDTQE
jgi:hypothetical protein